VANGEVAFLPLLQTYWVEIVAVEFTGRAKKLFLNVLIDQVFRPLRLTAYFDMRVCSLET